MTPLTFAASPIPVQCVTSGADAAVRAWQVDTLPLTRLLQALIYICVDTHSKLEETTDAFFWRNNGKCMVSFDVFSYLHTPP